MLSILFDLKLFHMTHFKSHQKFRCIVFVFLFSIIYFSSTAQCTLQADKTTACLGDNIRFSIPATTTFNAIKWVYGTGDTSLQPTSVTNYVYDTFGVFTASVTLYNSDGTVKCGPSTLIITIYDKPKADFILPLTDIMCFEQNLFCFKDNSKPGVFTGAPINSYHWDFGDGVYSSTIKNPCHSYHVDGTFATILTVTDTNGCWDTAMRPASITVLPKLNPKFETQFMIRCPETPVTFKNTMDTTGKNIKEWSWDFGDGTVITTDNDSLWGKPPFIYTYSKDGTFNPQLKIITWDGCVDSIKKFSGAKNIFYYFDIVQKSNPPQCWQDNDLCFTQKPRRNAYYWRWDFDDPPSMLLNTNDEEWDPYHHYKAPGVYHISLKIYEPNCIRDTTFCAYVPIVGPQAMINMPPPPAFPANDQLQAKPIPASYWHSMSSRCLNPSGDPVYYVSRTTTTPFQIGQIDSFCHSLLDSANFVNNYKPHPCLTGNPHLVSRDLPISSAANSTTLLYDDVLETGSNWLPGDNIPAGVQNGSVYFPKSGGVNIQTMHDTDLFKHDCSGPNYVRFTNNSIKYRWYYAIDDNPLLYFPVFALKQSAGTNPDMKFDQCYNPSYPWASDSMQYWWDFADATAKNCTSTVVKPDMDCKWSNEVQPWHLYKNDGCYSVTLSVTDTITNCMSEASVNIVMEAPNAGWDVAQFGLWKKDVPAMNWAKQLTTSPAVGKRGLILNGIPCVGQNYPQIPSFNETLPSCARQTWWMVFDSVNDCSATCSDTTKLDLDLDGIAESIEVHNTINCNWIDEMTFMMIGGQWIYGNGGWKTIGLILKTGDCFDTFFYHDYKYIAHLNSAFNINDPYKYNSQTGKYLPMDYSNNQHLRLCPNQQLILSISDTNQLGISSFKFFADKYFPYTSPQWPSVSMEDSFKQIKDTIRNLCDAHKFVIDPFTGKKIYTDCITHPDYTHNEKTDFSFLQSLYKKGYFVKDTILLLTLADTLFMKQDGAPNISNIEHDWSMTVPGKYRVYSNIKNVYGCQTGASTNIVVGHYANFDGDDLVICDKPGGDTVVFTHEVRYFWVKQTPFESDLNPNEFWVDPSNASGILGPPINPAQYGIRVNAPLIPEKVEWNFGDGSGWHTNALLTDTISWIFNKLGDYNISMRTTDSNGCVQILEKKKFIKVIGIVADFDMMNSPQVCAPQPVKFIDQSLIINNYKYDYNQLGQIIDSFKIDSVVSWKWNFNDGRGSNSISHIKSPTHTYIKNGAFDVKLIVKLQNGCTDTILKKEFIRIEGPEAKFWIYKNGQKQYSDTICTGGFITILDSTIKTTHWQFVKGDNSILSDTVQPFNNLWEIQYNTPGVYHIYLNATVKVYYPTPPPGYWGDCTATYGREDNPYDTFFTVVVLDYPETDFTASPASGTAPLTINFSDNSTLAGGTITNYYWEFGDGGTSTLKNPSHTYTYGNKYSVSLVSTSDFGCSDTASKMHFINVTSSLAELDDSEPRIYPNPTTNELFIEHANLIQDISIINELGEIVLKRSDVKQKSYHFDFLDLDAGLYLVKTMDINGSVYWSKLTIM